MKPLACRLRVSMWAAAMLLLAGCSDATLFRSNFDETAIARSSANAELADDPIVASIALPLLMAGIPSGAAASVRFAKSQLP